MVASDDLDPDDWLEFRADAHRALDLMVDYLEDVRKRPVWQKAPPKVRKRFDQGLPLEGRSLEEVLADFASARGYGDLKKAVAEVVVESLRPIREEYRRLMGDPAELDRLLAVGAGRARALAEPKVVQIKERVGFSVPAELR